MHSVTHEMPLLTKPLCSFFYSPTNALTHARPSRSTIFTYYMSHCVIWYRASKLLNELKSVEFEKLRNGREWPQIRAGDAIEVQVSTYYSCSVITATVLFLLLIVFDAVLVFLLAFGLCDSS
jgi:hypothetical protein